MEDMDLINFRGHLLCRPGNCPGSSGYKKQPASLACLCSDYLFCFQIIIQKYGAEGKGKLYILRSSQKSEGKFKECKIAYDRDKDT